MPNMQRIQADPLTLQSRLLRYQHIAKACMETLSAPADAKERDIANDSLKFWLANIAKVKRELSECQLRSVLTTRW
jgi:hypothetical protein